MIQKIVYTIAVVIGLMLARIVSATEPMQMTMTLQPDDEVVLIMAGSGKVTIDWGDRSPTTTHTLLVYDKEDWKDDWRKYAYSRAYSRKSRKSSLTITITGENITHLECNSLGLKSLDVSNNTALTELKCGNNPLMNLDVSKNIALTNLNCRATKLTSLDVSNNPKFPFVFRL